MPHGGLLQAPDESIRQQLEFGTTQTIRLARFLADHADAAGGRFIALGSIYGSQKPALNLAAYSLGKTALETTVRLLAPELARKQITINAVCPSFVPVGMNQQSAERQRSWKPARPVRPAVRASRCNRCNRLFVFAGRGVRLRSSARRQRRATVAPRFGNLLAWNARRERLG